MLLYSFIRCPWAMRARLALEFMGIKYNKIEVDLKNKPQELLDISPKGTVPVLVLPNSKILEESLDIILWAMPKPPFEQQQEINSIIAENDGSFKYSNARYKYPERYIEEGRSQEYHRNECEKFIGKLEQKLSLNRYLINDQISIADIAVFPLVRQFSIVDREWFAQSAYVNVKRWIEDISASDFFIRAMAKST